MELAIVLLLSLVKAESRGGERREKTNHKPLQLNSAKRKEVGSPISLFIMLIKAHSHYFPLTVNGSKNSGILKCAVLSQAAMPLLQMQ